MRISNPLANSYTRNQADSRFLTVDLSGSSSVTANLIYADTLDGKPESDYVLKNTLYPVGSIYMSINSTNPSTYFGGTWERIQGRFLLSADDDAYIAGNTGGEEKHSLTSDENGPHAHSIHVRMSGSYDSNEAITQSAYSGTSPLEQTSLSNNIVASSGNGTPHNNMPPYLVVYMWKRTA